MTGKQQQNNANDYDPKNNMFYFFHRADLLALRIMIKQAIQMATDRLNVTLAPFKSGNMLPAIDFSYQAFPVSHTFLFSPVYLLGMTLQAMIFVKHRSPISIIREAIISKSSGYTEDKNAHTLKPIFNHFNLQCGIND
jgi:hypothetical protein